VEASGATEDGRSFHDIRDFKTLLLEDERQVARNLVGQLLTYATGAAPCFSDRPVIEAVLDKSAPGYHVGSLLRARLRSSLFLQK
jgi:hypothetical protein